MHRRNSVRPCKQPGLFRHGCEHFERLLCAIFVPRVAGVAVKTQENNGGHRISRRSRRILKRLAPRRPAPPEALIPAELLRRRKIRPRSRQRNFPIIMSPILLREVEVAEIPGGLVGVEAGECAVKA